MGTHTETTHTEITQTEITHTETIHTETHSDTCSPLTQFHDGKEGDGTERCMGPQQSIVEHPVEMHSQAVSARQLEAAEGNGLWEVS